MIGQRSLQNLKGRQFGIEAERQREVEMDKEPRRISRPAVRSSFIVRLALDAIVLSSKISNIPSRLPVTAEHCFNDSLLV